MKRITRITALLLAVLLILPLSAGAAAPTELSVKENWFTGDNTLYRHGLAQASMILNSAASDQLEADLLASAGFSSIETYTEQNYRQLTLLTYTIGTATVGDQPVTAVVFRDPSETEQLRSVADFDGRDHGLTAGKNTELAVLLCSALAAMEDLPQQDNSCVWITGSGYAGGAAELLAALLNGETLQLEGEDVFYNGPAADVRAYAFGTPAVSRVASGSHKNIFIVNNPEDMMTHLPGANWGYNHFGQVIWTDTFNGENRASADMRTAVSENYKAFSDKTYYTFSEDDYKTNDTAASIIAYIAGSKLAPTLDAYYNNSYKAKVVPNLETMTILLGRTQTVYYTTYGLISDALSVISGGESDSFIHLAVGTYLFGTDSAFYPVISFIFEHALHLVFTSSTFMGALPQLLELKAAANNGQMPETYEMVCAHSGASYLAWVMAAQTPDQLSANAVKQLQWMDVTVSGGTVSYSANLPGSGQYWVAAYDKNGKMLKAMPAGAGLIADSKTVSNANWAKLFRLGDQYAPAGEAVSSK